MTYSLGWRKAIYDHSPTIARNLIASAYGAVQSRQRHGRYFWAVLNELKKFERAPNEVLLAWQSERLREFLRRAAEEVPYYRGLFGRHRFRSDQAGAEQLDRLPILEKEAVRALTSKLVSSNLRAYSPRWVHTSGTTGKALQFPLSSYCFQREYAFREQHYSWSGASMLKRQKLAMLAGHPVRHQNARKPPFWTYDLVNNWLLFSSYHMSEANLPAYVEELERFSPLLIGGYPSSVYLLALGYKKWGRGRVRPRAVYVASETLLTYQRRRIQDVFGCRVFMWYGNTEMCSNIVECEFGRYHGRNEHSFMEVVDNSGNPAQEGRLICTGFGNAAFPLVRYDTGDMVKIAPEQHCPCGRGGLLFESIDGRIEDYVVTPDGRLVGRLDHIFKDTVNVVEAQLIQTNRNELILRIVPRSSYTGDDETLIEQEARLRLGSEIRVRFEYAKSLERTATGKTRFVLSSVPRQGILAEEIVTSEAFSNT